jgi:hypothetical protein
VPCACTAALFSHRDAEDEPLLGAVVQVALEPPPGLVGRDHNARARGLDLGV